MSASSGRAGRRKVCCKGGGPARGIQSSTPRITLEALNTATACAPSRKPSSCALSLVTMAASVAPPSSPIRISLLTAPVRTAVMVPGSWLRADSRRPAPGAPTMTDEALTRASASLPGASSSSWVLSRVMVAVMTAAGDAQQDFVVDGARADFHYGTHEFVACAGLQHESPHQVEIAAGIHARVRQVFHEFAVFGFQGPEGRDQAASPVGQARAAAALAPGGAQHQRLACRVVHRIDGIPGALVAHAHRARGGRDGAGGVDLRQQVYAVLSAPSLGAGTKPNRAVEFQHRYQVWSGSGIFPSVMEPVRRPFEIYPMRMRCC